MQSEHLLRACDQLNALADWLAVRDVHELSPLGLKVAGLDSCDLLVLFGSSLPAAWDAAAEALISGAVRQIVAVGGIGRSTDGLWDVLEAQGYADVRGYSEADIIAGYLKARYDIGRGELLLERESTDLASNIEMARDVVVAAGMVPSSIVLVQDPSMQRRVRAHADLVWDQMGRPRWVSYSPYAPRLEVRDGSLAYVDPLPGGDWAIERWIGRLLSEIPRLSDTSEGPGPRGRRVLGHVDIPPDIRLAFAGLQGHFGPLVRKSDETFAASSS